MFECFLGFVGVFLGFGWGFFVGGGGGCLTVGGWGLGGQTSMLTVQFAYEACSRGLCLILKSVQICSDQPLSCSTAGWCVQQTPCTERPTI